MGQKGFINYGQKKQETGASITFYFNKNDIDQVLKLIDIYITQKSINGCYFIMKYHYFNEVINIKNRETYNKKLVKNFIFADNINNITLKDGQQILYIGYISYNNKGQMYIISKNNNAVFGKQAIKDNLYKYQ